MDPKIETNLEKVCELDVSKFEPFESDLDHAIEDRTIENLMNKAIIHSDIDINLYTKFILVSWDVGRPGLWYGIERFGTRKQFKTVEVNSERYRSINYDLVQGPGSKLYFQSLNSTRPFYCIILYMGSFDCFMRELKKYEDFTLHFPLTPADYLFPKELQPLLNEPYRYNSCRSELIRVDLVVERVVTNIDIDERLKM